MHSTSTSSIDQPILVSSDFLNIDKNTMRFSGNVIFEQRPDTLIQSDELFFNQDNETIISNTASLFTSETSIISSEKFIFNGKTKYGLFNNIQLQNLKTHRFTTAKKLLQINQQEQKFEHFSFTSCEPNDKAWELTSSSLSLNHNTGLGVAKHAKIYFFDVPIFYFPYFQFPIDDQRHSGLLMPSFSLSHSNGNTISIPIYWNIHPQLDSTIELNINSRRGLQVNTDSRYLTHHSKGSLTTSYLDDDKDNIKRYFYHLKQRSELNQNTQFDLDIQTVSEQDFFNDFSLISLSKVPKHLERHISVTHTIKHWNTTLLLQNHQILDESLPITSRPYEQWPKIASIGRFKPFKGDSQLDLKLSYVNFDKDSSVTAERYIFNPIISKKWSNSYSFIKPELSYSFSDYRLTNTDDSHARINRSLATFSLDSGLFFERIVNEKKGWLQTFEPRLFYVNTPYKDQSNIPIFDSANLSQNYNNLFSNNRFNGDDRIGDTKQLTLGVSSRLLDIDSGLELFRISLGQTYFSKNRLVHLDNTTVSEESTSDLFLEIASQPQKNWSFSANVTQQAETSFFSQKLFKISHQKNKQIINFSYHFKGSEDNTKLEQTDISMVYPINNRWKFFIKRQYSIIDHQNVEQLIGTSYDSCCWTFSIIALESTDDKFEDIDRSIYFQLTLKGLSSLGRNNEHLLTQSIPGYH